MKHIVILSLLGLLVHAEENSHNTSVVCKFIKGQCQCNIMFSQEPNHNNKTDRITGGKERLKHLEETTSQQTLEQSYLLQENDQLKSAIVRMSMELGQMKAVNTQLITEKLVLEINLNYTHFKFLQCEKQFINGFSRANELEETLLAGINKDHNLINEKKVQRHDLETCVLNLNETEKENITNHTIAGIFSKKLTEATKCVPKLVLDSGSDVALKRGYSYGFYGKDPMGDGKTVWFMHHFNNYTTLLVFHSESELNSSSNYKKHTLPLGCDGAQLNIYNKRLYCPLSGIPRVAIVDISCTPNVVGFIHMEAEHVDGHTVGVRNQCSYGFGGYSDIDIEVDEFGLWVIWGRKDNNCKMAASKVNNITLAIKKTWYINVDKTTVGNAFMARGVLYMIDSHASKPTYVRYTFDTQDETFCEYNQFTGIRYPNNHDYHYHLHYDYKDKALFAWEYFYQVKYNVIFDKN